MTTPIKSPRKLIEVALPLDAINDACSREKSIRHGHPSTLHLWWARRPLAAARAVLFAQLVNDPGYQTGGGFTRGVNKKEAARERERLFDIMRDLVLWENTNNEEVLERARAEIRKSWRETCELNKKHPRAAEFFNPEQLPAFHDPFAGGGAIPLEAQRLGLESHASDLNPVAVLINKAMIEIPPKFAGQPPVGPIPKDEKQKDLPRKWPGATGLAEDVRRYGYWMREQAQERIGHLYPKVEITADMARERKDLKPYLGQKLTVIAWLWARTVASPNPAYAGVHVPLISSFVLSSKKGREAWVEPVVTGSSYRFEIRTAKAGDGNLPADAKKGTKLSRGANFRCLVSDTPMQPDYIKAEGVAGRMGARLMAVVLEGHRERVYVASTEEMQRLADSVQPTWRPAVAISGTTQYLGVKPYGMEQFDQLFTSRQLVALSTFSDLVSEARERIRADAMAAGLSDDEHGLATDGTGVAAYAEAVATYLALGLSRLTDICNALCRWESSKTQVRNLFGRQAIPMMWDFAENNVFGRAAGDYAVSLGNLIKALQQIPTSGCGAAGQDDAQTQDISQDKVISTDPPYYDNVPYADISDFFYVWLRRSLRNIYPRLFATVGVPKTEELVAAVHRHGGREGAEEFFLSGMTAAMHNLAQRAHAAVPVSIYYAFKQSETEDGGTTSTGWVTFLEAVLQAGFSITGTWPLRTELANRMRGTNSNALASSIILVCRSREREAPTASRRDFLRELKAELSDALEAMLGGAGGASPIAPVDLAQAAIGPGMAVFSGYAAVLEADGTPMSVHTALTLINKQVDEVLGGESFDAATNFCLGWFREVGWAAESFGQADVLARAKATSVQGAQQAGMVEAQGGKVRLLRPADYPADWEPQADNNTPVWEALHHLVRALDTGGESAAGALLTRMPERSSDIRRLAFWLYTLCERKGWAEDARAYNSLVAAWPAIELASQAAGTVHTQPSLAL